MNGKVIVLPGKPSLAIIKNFSILITFQSSVYLIVAVSHGPFDMYS